MPRKSSIRRLDPAIRAEVDRLLAEGRHSLDQIVAHLRTLGAAAPSRSALGRYASEFEKVAARLRESREMARALAQELGPESAEGEQGRVLVESLRTLTFDVMQNRLQAGDGSGVAPKDLASLSRSVRDLSQAMRLEQDFAKRIREEARREAEARMSEAMNRAASGGAASPQELFARVQAIYRGEV